MVVSIGGVSEWSKATVLKDAGRPLYAGRSRPKHTGGCGFGPVTLVVPSTETAPDGCTWTGNGHGDVAIRAARAERARARGGPACRVSRVAPSGCGVREGGWWRARNPIPTMRAGRTPRDRPMSHVPGGASQR